MTQSAKQSKTKRTSEILSSFWFQQFLAAHSSGTSLRSASGELSLLPANLVQLLSPPVNSTWVSRYLH